MGATDMSLMVLSFKIQENVTSTFSKSNLAKAAKAALKEAAEMWRDEILPERFLFAKQSQYVFEPRTQIYLRIIKRIKGVGEGKSANLLLALKGTSFRFAKYFSSVTATQYKATITMRMPAYFTNPQIGTVYENGKRKQIRRQPNKVKELTQMTRANTDRINVRAADVYLDFLIDNSGSRTAGEARDTQMKTKVIA